MYFGCYQNQTLPIIAPLVTNNTNCQGFSSRKAGRERAPSGERICYWQKKTDLRRVSKVRDRDYATHFTDRVTPETCHAILLGHHITTVRFSFLVTPEGKQEIMRHARVLAKQNPEATTVVIAMTCIVHFECMSTSYGTSVENTCGIAHFLSSFFMGAVCPPKPKPLRQHNYVPGYSQQIHSTSETETHSSG